MPFDKTSADLLFGFISQRYERRSLVVTTKSAVPSLVRGVSRCHGRRCGHRPDRAPRHRADDRWRQLPAQSRHTQPSVPRDTGRATAIALVATRPPVAPLRPATSRRPPQLKNGGPFSSGQKVPFLLAIPKLREELRGSIETHNMRSAKPFRWTKSARAILDAVERARQSFRQSQLPREIGH